MTNNVAKKVKLVFSPELFKAAKSRAALAGQPLEDWVLALIEQHVYDKEPVQALDWGRIDSRIDQRTIFLERRLEVLAKRVDQLLKQSLLSTEAMTQSLDESLDDAIADRVPLTDIETGEDDCSRLTA